MFISTIIGRLLQSIEFFRSGFGRYFTFILEKWAAFKMPALALFSWGVVRATNSTFSSQPP